MLVVVLASSETAARLEVILPGILVLAAVTIKDARQLVRTEAVDGLLIDLAWLKRSDIARLRALERYSSVPIVWYGELSSGFFQAALDIGSWANPKIVLKGIEDGVTRIQEFFSSHAPERTRRALRDELQRRYFVKLTPGSQSAIELTWAVPPRNQTHAELATTAGYTPEWMRKLLVLLCHNNLAW